MKESCCSWPWPQALCGSEVALKLIFPIKFVTILGDFCLL